MARASRYGAVPNYLKAAADELCTVVMCESADGLSALSEVCQVPGVDAVLIGPQDLAASLGHLGSAGAPEVEEAIAGAFETVRAAGRAAGVMVGSEKEAVDWIARGIHFVGCGSDAALLRMASTGAARRLKERAGVRTE